MNLKIILWYRYDASHILHINFQHTFNLINVAFIYNLICFELIYFIISIISKIDLQIQFRMIYSRLKGSIYVLHEMANRIIRIDLMWWRETSQSWSCDGDKFLSFYCTAIDRTTLNVMPLAWYLVWLTLRDPHLDMAHSLRSRWKIAQLIWENLSSGAHPLAQLMEICWKFSSNPLPIPSWVNGSSISTQKPLTISCQGASHYRSRSTFYLILGAVKMMFIWMVIAFHCLISSS